MLSIFKVQESKPILITKDGKMILSLAHIIIAISKNLLDFIFQFSVYKSLSEY